MFLNNPKNIAIEYTFESIVLPGQMGLMISDNDELTETFLLVSGEIEDSALLVAGGPPPTVLSVPTISGTVGIGETLTAVSGTFADEQSVSSQWLADGQGIPGETGLTYVVDAVTYDAVISFAQTATNAVTSVVITSNSLQRPPTASEAVFSSGENGFSLIFTDTNAFTDTAGTTSVTTTGDTIRRVNDLTSNEEDVSGTVGPIWTSPDIATFDGTSQSLYSSVIPSSSEGTIIFYARCDLASSGFDIVAGSQSASNRCWLGFNNGFASFGIGGTGGGDFMGSSDLRSASQFVTVCGTWDTSGDVVIYVDGVEENRTAWTGTMSSDPICVGARGLSASTSDLFFDGDLVRCMVLDRALTQTEISDIHAEWSS